MIELTRCDPLGHFSCLRYRGHDGTGDPRSDRHVHHQNRHSGDEKHTQHEVQRLLHRGEVVDEVQRIGVPRRQGQLGAERDSRHGLSVPLDPYRLPILPGALGNCLRELIRDRLRVDRVLRTGVKVLCRVDRDQDELSSLLGFGPLHRVQRIGDQRLGLRAVPAGGRGEGIANLDQALCRLPLDSAELLLEKTSGHLLSEERRDQPGAYQRQHTGEGDGPDEQRPAPELGEIACLARGVPQRATTTTRPCRSLPCSARCALARRASPRDVAGTFVALAGVLFPGRVFVRLPARVGHSRCDHRNIARRPGGSTRGHRASRLGVLIHRVERRLGAVSALGNGTTPARRPCIPRHGLSARSPGSRDPSRSWTADAAHGR